ncbi:hypothetical protein TL16_g00066 [Triparma laevis f. inornata]|uniref:FAD/NAD(P)-binding domain-containing protein n=2 Tax=Triparma laevis TaxID=1534972 RepID=A0A9W7CDA8_9STRA|nr:hypothetical protein TL16_g00066 [Triparma laevis f. inornata]GMI07745.1 hypothetical protein TrLO_g11539 [Triparma laevis f. longispina]
MRHDWHSLLDTNISFAASGKFSREWYPNADTLVDYLYEAARPLKDHLLLNTEVTNTFFDEKNNRWEVETAGGDSYTADHLVVATGYRPRDPPVCLKEHAEKNGAKFYTYGNFPAMETGDEEWCSDRHIWVFGGGNAAWETTDMLAPCAKSVKLFHKGMPNFSFLTHYVGDVRIHNAAILDRYLLKSLDGLFNLWDIEKLTPTPGTASFESLVASHTGGVETQEPPPDIDSDECAAFEHLFFGLQDDVTVVYDGGFTTERDGIVNATFKKRFPELGRRSKKVIRHILQEHFDGSWPVFTFDSFEDAVGHAVRRIQEAAGLYQMQDVLLDILVANADGTFSYYEEVPKWWMTDIFPSVEKLSFVTVEFKYTNKDVWNLEIIADSSRNDRDLGIFLHPVVTVFWEGEKVPGAEYHLNEDAEGVWRGNNNLLELSFALHKAREQLGALATTGKGLSNAHAQTAAVLRNRCTERANIKDDDELSEHHLDCDDVHSVARALTQPGFLASIYNYMWGTEDEVDTADGTLRCEHLRNFAPPMQSHLNALNNSVASGQYSTAILLAKQLAICQELDESGPISTMVLDSSKKKKKIGLSSVLNGHVVQRHFTYVFDFQGVFNKFHHLEFMNTEEKEELKAFIADLVSKANTVEDKLDPGKRPEGAQRTGSFNR